MTPAELIAALEAAERGSREMDARAYIFTLNMRNEIKARELGEIFDGATVEFVEYCRTMAQYRRWESLRLLVPTCVVKITAPGAGPFFEGWTSIPAFTTDLNASLPGTPEGEWLIRSPDIGSQMWTARLWVGDADDGTAYYGGARTERLARCVAELKAITA